MRGEGRTFAETTEALLAYQHGVIELQARIKVRLGDADVYDVPPPAKATAHANGKLVETTVGRVILNDALPERLRFKNYPMKKENLKQIIGECFKEYGRAKTAELADEIKRLGFSYATKAGTTIAISDVRGPAGKQKELGRANAKIAGLENPFRVVMTTENERYQQTVDAWNEAPENVTKVVKTEFVPHGPIYTLAE